VKRGDRKEEIWENFFGKKFSQTLSKNFDWGTIIDWHILNKCIIIWT